MSDRDGLSGDDYVFPDGACPQCPGFIQQWLRDLTYDEIHAMELGLLGIPAAVGVHLGYRWAVTGFTMLLMMSVFGYGGAVAKALLGERFERAKQNAVARRLVRAEPWYFTMTFIASSLLTQVALGLL